MQKHLIEKIAFSKLDVSQNKIIGICKIYFNGNR